MTRLETYPDCDQSNKFFPASQASREAVYAGSCTTTTQTIIPLTSVTHTYQKVTMSADTTPISSARFSVALKELSVEVLRLKVLEIRNSIAHLQYSNDQLKPFAEGTATATGSGNSDRADSTTTSTTTSATTLVEPDQDCIDAIKENEQVIDRMAERIALIRIEVEERGVSWHEFQSKEEVEEQERARREQEGSAGVVNWNGAEPEGQQHSAWADGTFQMGTIRNGEVHFDPPQGQSQAQNGTQGGSLSDEQLRRALEERMRDLNHDDDDADGGMHL